MNPPKKVLSRHCQNIMAADPMDVDTKIGPTELSSSEGAMRMLAEKAFELEKQARGETLSAVLPANVAIYVRRGAELMTEDEDVRLGLNSFEQRCLVARCSLQCALQCCEKECRVLPKKSTSAASASGLMLFTESLRKTIHRMDEFVDLPPPVKPLSREETKRLEERRKAAERVANLEEAERKRKQARKSAPSPAYGAFLGWCGAAECSERLATSPLCCGDNASDLDKFIFPRGANLAQEAAQSSSLPAGARSLLESTSKALLEAAEAAAINHTRGLAARQFQRAALHLEILRLLGGRPLSGPLEESRRYARWRARHHSHLLENVVLEHGPEDPRTFEDVYEPTEKVLGKGGYGVVYKVRRRVDGVEFACKQLDLGRLSSSGLAQLHEEVNAMRRLDHPHVVRLMEVFYSERRRCYLVMELCRGGELFGALDRKCADAGRPVRVFGERRIAELTRQMLGAIRYMHSRGVAHRDVKLENWLFDLADVESAAHLKLVDFGLAKVYGPRSNRSLKILEKQALCDDPDSSSASAESLVSLLDDRVGSAYYCAPEVLSGEYDKRCDLWSLGVICYMLLCGAPPFWGSTDREILRRVKSATVTFPVDLFKDASEAAIDFVQKLLVRNVDKRMTAEQALVHPFISEKDTMAVVAKEAYDSLGEYLWSAPPGPPTPATVTLLESLRHFAAMDALERLAVETAAALMAPERLVALRDDFLAADKDGDGTLTIEELKNALIAEAATKQPSPAAATVVRPSFLRPSLSGMMLGTSSKSLPITEEVVGPAELEYLFNQADVDGSRRIGYREFAAAALYRRIEIDDDALHAAFDAIDSEGLGFINKEMVLATIGVDNLGGTHQSDIESAIQSADADGDGKIDIAEFLDYVKTVRLNSFSSIGDI